jgi:PAS domain S-box-containing protein
MLKSENGLSILTVEDNPSDLYVVEHMLGSCGLEIGKLHSADRVGKAVEVLLTQDIQLVLLDLTLPDSDGIHTFLSLKSVVQKIPVIILTGLSDAGLALEAIKEGAQDYLVKGEFNDRLLAKSIQYSLERKRNLQKLWVNNERFNTIVKVTDDAIWDWNIVSNEMFIVGDTYKQLFGYDFVNAVFPENLRESLLHPDDRDRVIGKLDLIFREGIKTKWEDEYRLRKNNGEYAYVHDRGHIIYSAGQQPVRMIGAISDITVRKRYEELILASEEKYRQIFYKNPYPALIYDLDTLQIVEVNNAAMEKYGFDKNEFLQMSIKDLYTPGQADAFQQAFNSPAVERNHPALEGALAKNLWHHTGKKGNLLIVEITSHLIDYFGKLAMQVVINDVTKKIRLEKELELEKKLQQRQITEVILDAQEKERSELGQELHDNINQILATSKLYLDVAIEENGPKIELLLKSRENISMALEELKKLSKELVTPILNDLGLVPSIKELIRGIRMDNKMNIRLNISGLEEKSLLHEQKINVYRIIQEQLNNILKHAGATTVVIELNRSKERIYLSVKDDGKGFDPRMHRKGVGISNIISRAELYNGNVEIESAPGKGCNLKVILNSKALSRL